ncbi:MAG TPA: DMT family transporter [Acidisarcina sp.]
MTRWIDARRIAAFILLSAIWGTSWIAYYEIDGHCPPLRAAALRYALAAVLLLAVAAIRRQPWPRGSALRAMLVLGVTLVALPFALLLWCARTVPAGTQAVIFALTPIALVLMSSAGRMVPAPRLAFYAALGGFGGMVAAMSGALSFSLAHVAGLASVLLAVVCVTASLVFAKRELQASSPLFSAGIQLAVAALVLVGLSEVMERGRPSHWGSESLISLVLLSVLGSGVALPLFYWLLQGWEAVQVGAVEWLQPLVSAAEGAALLHQPVPPTFLLGGLAVLCCTGVLLTSTKEHDMSLS